MWGLWATPLSARPQNLRQLSEITNKLTETSVSYGAIPALYRPRYDRVQDADLNMSQEDVVFVVMLPGGPRIYPQRFMVWHQVVNELIDDVAYAVTYCPITGTLMAYNASMNGLNLIFDLEGRLYDGNSVLIDRNSGSLWLQETGMAFDGPLLGRGMPTIPVFWTTWGAARRVYPDAPVLAQPRGSRPYGRDPYGSYLKKKHILQQRYPGLSGAASGPAFCPQNAHALSGIRKFSVGCRYRLRQKERRGELFSGTVGPAGRA